ncbi:MAG: DNA polymerase III subunit gamma and tau [Micrococcales bacterium]|nr:DNA polymerase III subunit gamma and tau [Micrococcales bacterium]
MVTALYRRYRPETFSELIGQSQVTDPLRTALRTDRVGHAYLFSGPRGCGKTTSARILARCLNCASGPTDAPCGTCDSCVELARGGGGSLDVIEIDAASHNGVDDARDLRDRAAYAPARDRYKIFILDEAHMVTTQGFNALLKLVEEPPGHVKFIFATTEPDKVIGTIRSRTHHYPFRLVPPASMLEYVQQLAEAEGVAVQPGVLPLVVRAGGGSVRDTLSLLDQLIAGSEDATVSYERAVALLGYTHGALLDEAIEALGDHDASAAFRTADRVVQTGQDPRRFVEDLLERLRDLIVVAATREQAAAVLRGIPQDDLERMQRQASAFGTAELSRAADVVNQALTEMTGATSPRLHLELMLARLLVPASDAGSRGTLARVERLERRIGIEGAAAGTAPRGTPAPSEPAVLEVAQGTPAAADSTAGPSRPVSAVPESAVPARESRESAKPARESAELKPVSAAPEQDRPEPDAAPEQAAAPEQGEGAASASPPRRAERSAAPAEVGPLTLQQVRDAWPEVLEVVQGRKRSAWMVVATAQARELNGDVLALAFPSENDANGFRGSNPGPDSTSEHLRAAIQQVLGVRVKFIARISGPDRAAAALTAPAAGAGGTALAAEPGWYVAPIPSAAPGADAAVPQPGAADGPAVPGAGPDAPAVPRPDAVPGSEAVRQPNDADTVPEPDDADAVPEPDDADAPADPEPPEPEPVVEVPAEATSSVAPEPAPNPTAAPDPASTRTPRAASAPAKQRYGEAVVRELLQANFLEETNVAPRVRPVAADDAAASRDAG